MLIYREARHLTHPDLTPDHLRFIFPDEVKVKYYANGSDTDIFPRIGKSVITNFDVSYGTESVLKVFPDGSPVSATLTLTVKEVQLNNRKTDTIPWLDGLSTIG